MPEDKKTVNKEETVKDDGRYIILYSFEEELDAGEPERGGS